MRIMIFNRCSSQFYSEIKKRQEMGTKTEREGSHPRQEANAVSRLAYQVHNDLFTVMPICILLMNQ